MTKIIQTEKQKHTEPEREDRESQKFGDILLVLGSEGVAPLSTEFMKYLFLKLKVVAASKLSNW